MSYKKKISVVVLGNGDSLKEALITNIVGKDLSQLPKRKVQNGTKTYENELYEFICTPNLNTESKDIRKVFDDNRHPDMSLLVVEEGFSPEEVWKQIEQLSQKTGKGTDEFIVVLPLHCKRTDYPFKCCTVEQVFSNLRKLTEGRDLMSTSNRHVNQRESYKSTLHSPMGLTGGQYSKEQEGPQRSLKRKHAGTKVTLVLLGMSGTGKSASGNTILRKKQFKSKISSKPVTIECQEAETMIDGTRVRVIDTPDIFDDQIESSVKAEHVRKCKELCQQEPCVFLLVMQLSRFTDGERDIMKKLEKAFYSGIHEQTVILFTRGEELQHAGMSFEVFLHSCQPDLKKIIEKCGNRCVLFENRASDSRQVEKLMETVDRMIGRLCVQGLDQLSEVRGCGLFSCIRR